MRTAIKTKQFICPAIRDIVLIGCGGTGSIVAEHICRMIKGFRLRCGLHLYDGDTVSAANITRQNFANYEIGGNKAEALAMRLAGRFGIAIAANAHHFDRRVLAENELIGDYRSTLIVSCTDSLVSRKQIASRPQPAGIWLDAGNELHHGQVVVGTTHRESELRKEFWAFNRTPFVLAMPDIAAQNPAILKARRQKAKAGCADVPFAQQGFGVNAMAAIAAATIAKQILVDSQLKIAAIYFDIEKGIYRPQAITQDLYRRWKNKDN